MSVSKAGCIVAFERRFYNFLHRKFFMLFNAVSHTLHAAASGALATQSARMPGYPYTSALPFVLDEQHRPVFLISSLAEHTCNLIANSRASLLVYDSGVEDILANARLTLMGEVSRFELSRELLERYLRYQPGAEQYLALAGFAFFRFMPKRARFVAGFGRMGWLEENEWTSAAVLPLANEAALIDELANAQPTGARLLGIDRYGFDVTRGGVRERRQFADAPVAIADLAVAVKRLFPGS
jgi:hypothetical protein